MKRHLAIGRMTGLVLGLTLVLVPAASAQLPAMTVADGPDPVRLADQFSTAPVTFDVAIQNTTGSPFQDARLGPVGSASFGNSLVSANASQGSCTTAIQSSCSLGTIPPGGTVTAKFVWAANAPETTVATRWLLDETKDPLRRVEVQVSTTIIVGPPQISDVSRSGSYRRGFEVGFRISEAVPTLVMWLERKRRDGYKVTKALATAPAAEGAQTVELAARLTRGLKPGIYRIRMQGTATDGAKSNIAATKSFTVKRRG